jgi:hypothetical protein
MQPAPAVAQTELTVLGGATGADVFCIQAGSPTTGAFTGTFLQTGKGVWEKRLKDGTVKFDEKSRDDLMVELFDSSHSASVQIDFVTKSIREKSSQSADTWTDGFVILNATNKAKSDDCVAAAARSAAIEPTGTDDDDEADDGADDADAKAAKPSKRKKADSSKKSKKSAKRPSRRKRAQKKQSGSGFSIGIGGGGIGF